MWSASLMFPCYSENWTWHIFIQGMWAKRWGPHYLERVKQVLSVLPVQSPEIGRQVHKCSPQERSESHYPLEVLWALSHLGKCWCPLLAKNQTTHLKALCTAVADCQEDWVQGRLVSLAHLCHSIPLPERNINMVVEKNVKKEKE